MENCNYEQKHVHELLGSTRLAEIEEDPHNHKFADVSGQAIPVGKGRHVHFVQAVTTVNDDHSHKLIFATLIEAPTFEG